MVNDDRVELCVVASMVPGNSGVAEGLTFCPCLPTEYGMALVNELILVRF